MDSLRYTNSRFGIKVIKFSYFAMACSPSLIRPGHRALFHITRNVILIRFSPYPHAPIQANDSIWINQIQRTALSQLPLKRQPNQRCNQGFAD